MADYAAACRTEISAADVPPADTVFFGGGTPSLMPAELLVGILEAIPRRPGAEVTVECNPESVTASLLGSYRVSGVNRLSFGVQSMAAHVLAALGRVHDPNAVRNAVSLCGEAGFPTFNVDLIYGAAGESDDDWARTLGAVLALDPAPPHVSAYALTIEPGTPLATDPSRFPDDDVQADRYFAADRRLTELQSQVNRLSLSLTAAGLEWYETSNWARPGHECRHNRSTWRQADYRSIGCAAHSHRQGRRWWNVRTPDRYIRAMNEGASPVAGEEVLDDGGRAWEALVLALRTRDGIPAAAVPDDPALDGLVVRDGDRVRLTGRGRLLVNAVVQRLR